MLPWMKNGPKQSAGIAMQVRKPDEGKETPNEDPAVLAAAEDILRAIDSKDAKHLAQALRAAFQILDSEPDEEGPQMEDEQDEG